MKITWLGHSAFRIETAGAVILMDPFLIGNRTFEGAGLKVDEVSKGTTHVALTHGHSDHIGDAAAICQKTGATLVACFEVCNYLASHGVKDYSPGNPGGEIRFDGFSIAFTPAFHSSSVSDNGQTIYMGNPCGLVVHPERESGKAVYHMGDTSIFSDMALIHELYEPSIGMVPIGDRFTMGARQAALACTRYFKFQTVFPCHYATFDMIGQSAEPFVRLMPDGVVKVPKAGEVVEVLRDGRMTSV